MRRMAFISFRMSDEKYVKPLKVKCGRPIENAMVSCPTGEIRITACSAGMHELILEQPAQEIDGDVACDELLCDNRTGTDIKILQDCIQWLKCFFRGDVLALNKTRPPLCSAIFNTESFRSRVWCTLESQTIFGQTVSYGELAKLCGSPRASQAVGSAMRNNPLSLIVPCHRVIRSSGALGNYAGGKMNHTKIWLVEHEKKFSQ